MRGTARRRVPDWIAPLYHHGMTDDRPYPVHPPVARTETALKAMLSAVRRSKNPLTRAQSAGDVLNMLQEYAEELREVRTDAVAELNEQGMGYATIAAELGVSKGRVQQFLGRAAKPIRMSRTEAFARTEAQRLREEGANDDTIVDTMLPALIDVRSAERFTAATIADMLDVPVKTVRTPWNRLVKEKKARMAG